MSIMGAEISRIVNEDISNRVTQYDVLYEAITNAIQANASEIICEFNSYDNPIKENGIEIIKKKLDTIKISDNGDGFNDENFNSFCKYRSKLKSELGGKGIGRFVFLKVYENVNFTSELVKEQEIRNFKFNIDFDTENLKKQPSAITKNLTFITLNKLTNFYINENKHIDRRIDLDIELIREKVLFHLIPSLFFYKKKKKNIQIEFIDLTTNEKKYITYDDIPNFKDIDFYVMNNKKESFKFTLNHSIENKEGRLNSFYCGNYRTVCEFSEKDFTINLPYGYSGYLLVESEYLSKRVNNNRNDFEIFPKKVDAFSTISWEMINSELKSVISEIVKEGIPETKEINKEKINQIQEERPYLVPYIDDEDIEMAGFLDKKSIIEKAKKRFDSAKEKLLANAGKDNYTDQELKDAIEITQNELVSYINDRAQVIERLKKLLEKKERVESVIHNLFMERYTTDDYYCVGKNNLWLIDDRFTTYSYAASEKRILDVLKDIGENGEGVENLEDKPDLSLFFSHNPQNPERLKSVLVEIKPFDFKSKSDRKKFQGIQQLVDYVEAFKNKENVEEIFAFLITDIDIKLADRLKKDDYTPLFSTESPIFHRFYKELGISIYVISAKTLVSDAEARNKVFLDIIRKQSKINKLLDK
jgi:hypothetical protein